MNCLTRFHHQRIPRFPTSHPLKLKPSSLSSFTIFDSNRRQPHYSLSTNNPHRFFFTPRLSSTRSFSCRSTQNDAAFNEAAYESERLTLDAKARKSMVEAYNREIAVEDEEDPKAWKWVIRKRVCDMMEARNFAQNPRPVHPVSPISSALQPLRIR